MSLRVTVVIFPCGLLLSLFPRILVGYCCHLSLLVTVVTVPPYYPYALDDPSDVPLDQCWYACPQLSQLLFACHLPPRHGRLPKRISYTYGEDDFRVELVFYTESAAPSSPWTCLVQVQRKFRGCQNFTSPSPRPYSTWTPSPMFGGACP